MHTLIQKLYYNFFDFYSWDKPFQDEEKEMFLALTEQLTEEQNDMLLRLVDHKDAEVGEISQRSFATGLQLGGKLSAVLSAEVGDGPQADSFMRIAPFFPANGE